MSIAGVAEAVPEFAGLGFRAFTTTRASGSFGFQTTEPACAVMDRWSALRGELRTGGDRFATASQVHGSRVIVHGGGWTGWLRGDDADGHVATERGTGLAVTIADCVPVFIAHPSGAAALLHSGWRGTAARIVEHGIEALVNCGIPARDLHLHLGPAICGNCYEVSADVARQLTGRFQPGATKIDLRALIADHARGAGVRHISVSALCTRCDNDRFFSHRAGDSGRQLAVVIADR